MTARPPSPRRDQGERPESRALRPTAGRRTRRSEMRRCARPPLQLHVQPRFQRGGAIAAVLLGLLSVAAWPPWAAAVGAWSPMGPPDGATVQALAFAPSDSAIVYAGLAGGGVQRSDDGGATWRPGGLGVSQPGGH